MECLSYCIASAIDLTRFDHYVKAECPHEMSSKFRDVLVLKSKIGANYTLFVFKNGTMVSWGLKRYQVSAYLDLAKRYANKLLPFVVHDEFSYRVAESTTIAPHGYFEADCLTLEEDTDELKLSLSYGFSQSVKLQFFETIIEALIEKYTPLIQTLSNKGHMPLSRNEIRKIIGEILGSKSEMNLISNFMYHPKFFWRHPSLEIHYSMLERYLHIQRRVNAINHRLDTLNEIFDMFNGYLENRHAHFLEIIIIGLIMVEIILMMFGGFPTHM